ncbi:MAG TPA: FG-GAP-like repeat-containing protein [Bryobacteraceae bacterium]|nr:FG-GAP-like repeat-containing protein [Bryobacteraceae bacterium]
MRVSWLRFLAQFSITALVTTCAWAQPGCPAINFQTSVLANSRPTDFSNVFLVSQSDGSYTGYETTQGPPYTVIATTPNYQKQLTACLPSHAARPPLAAPTGTGNVPGAPSQPQAFARLSSGNYLVVNPDLSKPGSVSTVALFDPELNFISQSQLPVFAGSAILADVNGDGIPDLVGLTVVVNGKELQGTATLVILLGKADGSFEFKASHQLMGTNFSSATFAVGDLNGDHKPDVVVASQGFLNSGGTISVLLGNGDGTFQPERVAYTSATAPYAVAIADLNGDGKADLAFTRSGGLGVALGNGDGTFATPDTYQTLGTLPNVYPTLAIGDVNGDGIPDIVTSGVSIFFGDGTGKFPKRQDYLVPYTNGGIILTDVDGDGGIDIVEGSGNALIFSPSWILFDRGDGTYLGPKVSLAATSNIAETLVSGDFDSDGIPDLVSLNGSGTDVLAGDGAGHFSSTYRYDFNSGTPGALASTAGLVVGDFNNDGKLDFAAGYQTSPGSGIVAVFFGRGDGTFQQPVKTTIPSGAVSLATGDFNGDGKLDLAVVTRTGLGASQDAILILIGKGDGTFSAPLSYPAAADVSSVVVGDFNNDGKPDLAVVNTYGGTGDPSSTIGFLLGKGDGTFTTGTSIPIPDLFVIAVGDLNHDGKLDIAAGTTGGLTIFLGRGDGTFTTGAVYSNVAGSSVLTDLNGDGNLDLLLGTAYLPGNGDGTFQPPVPLFGNSSSFYSLGGPLIAADLNHDSKIDLVGITTLGVVSFLNISQPQPAVTVVSSASFTFGPVAPESLATAFGNNLATSRATAPLGQPFPTMLGGNTVNVQDASGATRPAQLLYVSPGQVNFVIPAGTSNGAATVTITNPEATSRALSAQVQIAPVEPAMFMLNANGLAAAYATLMAPGQQPAYESVFMLQSGSPVAAPFSLGTTSQQAYLTLYGTGFRNAGGVTVEIQGLNAPVSSSRPVNGIDGLDQVTVMLPRALAGSGDVNIVVTAAGLAANTVQVTIQ